MDPVDILLRPHDLRRRVWDNDGVLWVTITVGNYEHRVYRLFDHRVMEKQETMFAYIKWQVRGKPQHEIRADHSLPCAVQAWYAPSFGDEFMAVADAALSYASRAARDDLAALLAPPPQPEG